MKDALGKKINAGDFIVYPVACSPNLLMKVSLVLSKDEEKFGMMTRLSCMTEADDWKISGRGADGIYRTGKKLRKVRIYRYDRSVIVTKEDVAEKYPLLVEYYDTIRRNHELITVGNTEERTE